MARNYLSFLPQKFMRVIAGFYKGGGQYFLRRAGVPVPQALQSMVWRDLDDWQHRFRKHNEGIASSYQTGGIDELDMAAQGFVELLIQLRIIFLQDSAVLICKHPDHTMWRHPVFQHPEWSIFASQVRIAEAEKEEPMDIQLQKVIPIVAEKIASVQEYVSGRVEYWGNTGTTQYQGLRDQLTLLTEKLGDFTDGRIPFYISPRRPLSLAAAVPESSMAPIPFSLASQFFPETLNTSASDGPPTYVMCPKVVTLVQLWREWNVGLAGKPSVQSLEDLYGYKWRSSFTNAQKMWFSRRKFLIDEIKRRSVNDDLEKSLNKLEVFREEKKLSLNSLHDHLRGKSKSTDQSKRKR